jgi:hypothetical protein
MPVVRNNARLPSRPAAGPRVIRNVAYVNRQKRLARWSALVGLALLGSTFWLLLDPARILLAYGILFVGMILFHRGMQQIAKWNARNDVRLDALVGKLGDRYALVHYAPVGKRTIEHLLIHPGGLLVLSAYELAGTIRHRDGRWRKVKAGLSRLFGLGGPQLGDPSRETRASVEALTAFLEEAQLEVEVDGAIVFLNPLVTLDVEEPDYPVTNAEGLPELVRSLPVDAPLRPSERQALIGLFSPTEGGEAAVTQPAPRRRPVKRRAA